MTKLNPRSADAWRRFRERVEELGGTILEPEWLGNNKPHRVLCPVGHACTPRPSGVLSGRRGLCHTCAGHDPVDTDRRFRERIAELGGTVVEPKWLGNHKPHRVRCAKGHDCLPRPSHVLRGIGICRICAGRDPADSWRRFRERVSELGGTVTEPEWLGTETPHRVLCAAGHACTPRPHGVLSGWAGLCRVCAGNDPDQAERWFRERVAELGGTVIEPEWLGTAAPHKVVCAAGHECAPRPTSLRQGQGMCRTCAGRDSADAWRRFRARVEELGGTIVEPEWLGANTPHRVICAAGHECSPAPGNLLTGQWGLCRVCAYSSSSVFYVVESGSLNAIKIGITSGDGRGRLGSHRRDGFTMVLRLLRELDDAAFLELHTLRTLKAAGVEPVRGREYFERWAALPVVLDIVDNWLPQ